MNKREVFLQAYMTKVADDGMDLTAPALAAATPVSMMLAHQLGAAGELGLHRALNEDVNTKAKALSADAMAQLKAGEEPGKVGSMLLKEKNNLRNYGRAALQAEHGINPSIVKMGRFGLTVAPAIIAADLIASHMKNKNKRII